MIDDCICNTTTMKHFQFTFNELSTVKEEMFSLSKRTFGSIMYTILTSVVQSPWQLTPLYIIRVCEIATVNYIF